MKGGDSMWKEGILKAEKEYFEGINAARIERESANAAVIISEKNAEIEDLKYQLRLHKQLVSHIFREYQAVRGIKAVDVIA
jgi:hypothetical protein